MPAPPPARLALENGVVFSGTAFGACEAPLTTCGEVVFNTAMTGYQEALTDPSYAGQILTMTTPLIGNYGVAPDDVESGRPQVEGFVVRELARRHSNRRASGDLGSWLAEAGVLGIEGIDTRALVRNVREEGVLRGVLSCDPDRTNADLVAAAASSPLMAGRDLACAVAPDAPYDWEEDLGEWGGSIMRKQHHAEIPGDERLGDNSNDQHDRRITKHSGFHCSIVAALSQRPEPSVEAAAPARASLC